MRGTYITVSCILWFLYRVHTNFDRVARKHFDSALHLWRGRIGNYQPHITNQFIWYMPRTPVFYSGLPDHGIVHQSPIGSSNRQHRRTEQWPSTFAQPSGRVFRSQMHIISTIRESCHTLIATISRLSHLRRKSQILYCYPHSHSGTTLVLMDTYHHPSASCTHTLNYFTPRHSTQRMNIHLEGLTLWINLLALANSLRLYFSWHHGSPSIWMASLDSLSHHIPSDVSVMYTHTALITSL